MESMTGIRVFICKIWKCNTKLKYGLGNRWRCWFLETILLTMTVTVTMTTTTTKSNRCMALCVWAVQLYGAGSFHNGRCNVDIGLYGYGSVVCSCVCIHGVRTRYTYRHLLQFRNSTKKIHPNKVCKRNRVTESKRERESEREIAQSKHHHRNRHKYIVLERVICSV